MPYTHPYKPNPNRRGSGTSGASAHAGNDSAPQSGRSFEERMDAFGRRMEEKAADLDRRAQEWSRRVNQQASGRPNTGEPDAQSKQTPGKTGDSVDEFVDHVMDLGANLGNGILGTLSDALSSAGDAISGWRNKGRELTFPQWRDKMDRRLRVGSQSGFLAMAVLGGIFAFSFGVTALVMLILSAVGPEALHLTRETFVVFPILTGVFTPITVGFGILTGFGVKGYRLFGRIRSYLRAAHDWACPVSVLARATGRSTEQVRRELARAITDGKLSGVFLSTDGDRVFFREEEFLRDRQERAEASASPPRPAQPQPERTDPAAQPKPMTPAEQFQQDGREFLRYLAGCQGRLDPAADEELLQMRKTCKTILDFVQDHPGQLSRMHRFGEYYIPTTRKLLDTALDLGPVEADNARVIRRDITGILHTLNMAYVRLYDTLLQDISLDVSTEIDTLEAMLRQDGLAGGFTSDFGAAAPQ